jgi:NAD(P)-dependent dehydrogenase (short-subunit alcohol dehydrogenase family)
VICLVTGATSGIGKEAAARLAARGDTVVLPARTHARGEQAAADIRRRVPDARIDVLAADLSLLPEVRSLAAAVRQRYDRLDLLVNNAGVIRNGPLATAGGLDTTLAVNHLAPFLLTCPARVRPRRASWPISRGPAAISSRADGSSRAPWPATTRRPPGCGRSARS